MLLEIWNFPRDFLTSTYRFRQSCKYSSCLPAFSFYPLPSQQWWLRQTSQLSEGPLSGFRMVKDKHGNEKVLHKTFRLLTGNLSAAKVWWLNEGNGSHCSTLQAWNSEASCFRTSDSVIGRVAKTIATDVLVTAESKLVLWKVLI